MALRVELVRRPAILAQLAMQPPVSTPGSLRIVSPRNGDVFLLEAGSSTKGAAQRLEFKLAVPPTRPVEWRLNGQLLGKQASPSVFWTPQPGAWTLQVTNGQQTHQVDFQIEVAERTPTRRGFSFAGTSAAQ